MLELNKIYNMNCIDGLKLLDDESINCCVTSPPYWGLRDYGTAQWVGGDINCNHLPFNKPGPNAAVGNTTKLLGRTPYKNVCAKCGAIRKDEQFGLEETPEEYVANMVKVFSEVKRVLRKDGTLWLNIGDSYSGSGKGAGGTYELSKKQNSNKGSNYQVGKSDKRTFQDNCKPKDLVGIPWRVAFALQQDGWYLRQDIIWAKPNPMPESVMDRCTKSHEYIFLLSKSAHYYFDNEAIREPFADSRMGNPGEYKRTSSASKGANNDRQDLGFLNNGSGWNKGELLGGRNKRSVWTVTTKPFKEAHFATFPEDLIKPCILAGCPEKGIVLDPFMGAGTTGLVSVKHQRNFIGFELNKEYIDIANARIEPYLAQQSLFEEAENAELRSEANKLIDLLGGE